VCTVIVICSITQIVRIWIVFIQDSDIHTLQYGTDQQSHWFLEQ